MDLDGLLSEAATSGTQFDDFTMTTTLVFGGMVSLDGIHLTTRGYALMAKKILEGIDATYGSNFGASGSFALLLTCLEPMTIQQIILPEYRRYQQYP